MKKTLILLVAFAALSSFSSLPTEVEEYKLSVEESEITWKAHKVTGSHEGTVNLVEGSLSFEDGVLAGGNFVVDMTSIANTDLEGEWKAKLEGHLKSEDFFGVEQHPKAAFTITKVAHKGTEGDYKVTGDLTIKGHTKEIKFYVHTDTEEGKVVTTADITIDRTDFDVRYGSGSFFDNLGDKTIYDEFELSVKLVSSKQ